MNPETFSGPQLLTFTATPWQARTQNIRQPFMTVNLQDLLMTAITEDSHASWPVLETVSRIRQRQLFSTHSTSSQLAVSFLLHFKVILMGAEPRIFYTEERALEQKSGPMLLTHCVASGLALLFLSL